MKEILIAAQALNLLMPVFKEIRDLFDGNDDKAKETLKEVVKALPVPEPVRENRTTVVVEEDLEGLELLEVEWDGPGGWLYKPGGDHSGTPVILSPADMNFTNVSIYNTQNKRSQDCRYTGRANGNRQHWRVDEDSSDLRKRLGRGKLEIRALEKNALVVLKLRGLRKRVD